MFRVDIEGKMWIAILPRPNYSLEKEVLFGSELVKLAKHQFAILCSYRCLGAPVPPAAFYTFQLSESMTEGGRIYSSACILLENMIMEGLKEDQVMEVTKTLFPFDVLFGNWSSPPIVPISNTCARILVLSKNTLGLWLPQ